MVQCVPRAAPLRRGALGETPLHVAVLLADMRISAIATKNKFRYKTTFAHVGTIVLCATDTLVL
jgi:hypothetical protein